MIFNNYIFCLNDSYPSPKYGAFAQSLFHPLASFFFSFFFLGIDNPFTLVWFMRSLPLQFHEKFVCIHSWHQDLIFCGVKFACNHCSKGSYLIFIHIIYSYVLCMKDLPLANLVSLILSTGHMIILQVLSFSLVFSSQALQLIYL